MDRSGRGESARPQAGVRRALARPAARRMTGPASPVLRRFVDVEDGSSRCRTSDREARTRSRTSVECGRMSCVRRREKWTSRFLARTAAIAARTRPDVPARAVGGVRRSCAPGSDFELRGSDRGVTLVAWKPPMWRTSPGGGSLSGGLRPVGSVRWSRPRSMRERMAGGIPRPPHSPTPTASGHRRASHSRPHGSGPCSGSVDGGVRARGAAALGDAISDLDRHLEPGDVLVSLGSGDVGTISDASLRRLPGHRHGR